MLRNFADENLVLDIIKKGLTMSKKQMKEISMADNSNWTDKFTNKVPIEKLMESIEGYQERVCYLDKILYEDRLDRDLKEYRAFNSVLTDLLRENGGYIQLYRELDFREEYIEWMHNIRKEESLWGKKPPEDWNENHHYEVMVLYDLWQELDSKVRKRHLHLKDIGELPEDVIPAWELEETSKQGEGDTSLPHFNLKKSDKELLAILNRFKTVEWTYKRVKHKGFFAREVSDDEWLTAMKGTERKRLELKNKIPWLAKYVCKSFVQQYLNGNYELAEKIFCLRGGEELKDLANTNISKNKNICDEHTGQIAHIIRRAMSQ